MRNSVDSRTAVSTLVMAIALVGGTTLGAPAPARGVEPPAARTGLAIPVQVANDEDEPVPVVGTVTVGNLPAVQSVEVSGSPTVHVASMPPVAVTSSELPFQWAGSMQVGPNDPGSDCIELLPTDLPAGMALVVEQIAAVSISNDPAAEAQYIATIPVPTPESPDAEAFFTRELLDPAGQTQVLEENVLLGGPGGATSVRACVLGPSISMDFRLFGHLVPVSPPAS